MKIKTFILTFLLMSCPFLFGQNWWDTDYDGTAHEDYCAIIAKFTQTNTIVGAFVDNELRGKGTTDNNGLIFLNVNASEDAEISFKLYDGEKELNYFAPLVITGDMMGSVREPIFVKANVVAIDEETYASLAEALAAAQAGNTLTFLADITEDVTVTKAVTIDGDGKTYTGKMTAKADLTINNVNFDGKGYNGYAVETRGANYLTVEECTAKNYGYGFIQLASGTALTTVKNVTVSNMNYGVKVDYSNAVVLENVDITVGVAAVLNQNYGEKTITIKNSELNILGTWVRNNTIKTNYVFEGANTVGQWIIDTAIDNFKLAVGATVIAPNTIAGTDTEITATATEAGYAVEYKDGTYRVRQLSGKVAYRADVTDKADREGIAILLKDVYAQKSLVVKVYNDETLMFTCTRRDIDDEDKVMFPVDANTTANIVLWGKESGSWINEIHVAPTAANVPNKIEVYSDNVLVDTYTNKAGTVLGENLNKYLALDCVYKAASITNTAGTEYYMTFADALANVEDGDVLTLFEDITSSSIITINKAITLDGNGKTLTSTAGRAINVSGADGVTIKDLTIKASGERAINIIQNATNVTIENVTATAANYTVNVASSAPEAVVAIKNSNLTGLNVVNVASEGANVTVDGGKLICNDQNANENYAALALNKDGKNATITATGVTFDIKGDSMKAKNGAEGGVITIDGETEEVAVDVAYITYGDYYYGYQTIEAAIAKAEAGQTIGLIRDITSSSIITINKAITLDGNGKTLTSTAGRAINIETEGNVKINNLNVNAAERAFNIINEAATVELNKVTATANNNAVMIATSAGEVNLTINDSDLTGLAVVNVAGAGSQVFINDTKITNVDNNTAENYGAITISKTGENAKVTVDGGEIIVADDSKKAYVFPVNAEVIGVDPVNYILATVGDAGFDNLAEVIEYANETVKSITIIRPFVLTGSATYDLTGINVVGDVYPMFRIQDSATVTFNGGNFTNGDYIFTLGEGATESATSGNLIINGGKYHGETTVANVVKGNLTINGGEFSISEDTEYNYAYVINCYDASLKNGKATVEVKGGTFHNFDPENNAAENPKVNFCAEGYLSVGRAGNIWTVERATTQELALLNGWNWVSHYVIANEANDGEILAQMQEQLETTGEIIKTQGQNTFVRNTEGVWAGGLKTTSVEKLYKVQTAAKTVNLTGAVVEDYNIELVNGWNWIGYPLTNGQYLTGAFTPNNGDWIKGRNAFAEYYNGAWYGHLKTLEPGQGYMYYYSQTTTTTNPAKLTYNIPSSKGAVEANITTDNNYWTVEASEYANNMSMVATLGADSENYELAAFVNGEVRGSARPIYVEAVDAYMFFLTINGDDVEEVTFKCYDIDTDTEYTLNEGIIYSSDAILGSVREPYVLRGTLGMDEVSANAVAIYPNPTTTANEIMLSTTCDKVEVFNSLGVKVAEYQNVDAIEALETAGVYVIRVTNNDNVQNCRLVVK